MAAGVSQPFDAIDWSAPWLAPWRAQGQPLAQQLQLVGGKLVLGGFNGVQQEIKMPGGGFHLLGIGGHDHMVGALATAFLGLAG